VLSSGVKKGILTLKMAPIACPESSVINHHDLLRNNPEERGSHNSYMFRPYIFAISRELQLW